MIVTGRRLAAVVATLALAASVTSIVNDFTYDDRVIILENPRAHSVAKAMKAADETYWPRANGAALYRPLTIGLFASEWTLGGGSPRLFHAVSIALYIAVCTAVCALLVEVSAVAATRSATLVEPDVRWHGLLDLRRPRVFAVVAAAVLFAVHPLHVESVANVVGQSELVVALALVVAFLIHLACRRAGEFRPGQIAAIVALYIAACLTKEHAVVFPALLIAAELTILRSSPAPVVARRRLGLFGALALSGVVYLLVRASVVGGVSGEIPHLAMRQASLPDRLLTMLAVAPEWLRLLFWPAHLSADYSPREIELLRTVTPTAVAGLLLIISAFALMAVTWRRRPVIALGVAWIAIALLPISNVIVPTGILLAERTLFLASIGAALVVAGSIEVLVERFARQRWELATLATVAGVVSLAGLLRSATRQQVWKNNSTLFAQMLLDAPLSYRAHWAHGAQLFEAGKPEQGETEMRIAIALFPHDADLKEDLASRYFRAGLCLPAVPAFRGVLEIDEDRTTARMGLAACLLRQGDFRGAALAARSGPSGRTRHPDLERLAVVADSLAGAR